MSLDNIAIVLVRTSHPGNIGAAARAMANMGLSDLRLIEPAGFPGTEATARAAGATHVLENAQICRTVDEAIADSGFVVGATARSRSIAWPSSDPSSVMKELVTRSQVGKVSLLFGREASGLTNEELDRCQRHVRVPVDEDFPSLNLAAAVLIFCYELRRAYSAEDEQPNDSIDRSVPLASAEQVQGFFQHLETVLNEIGFLKSPSSRLLRKIKRIFSRTPLQVQEVNILRGILTSVQHRELHEENQKKGG
jgi:tRNA (cytidine32/uridine32-2'-O)-methyltransferase